MKIAVTYENGQVFQHFGHCASFKFYDVENGEIKLMSDSDELRQKENGSIDEIFRRMFKC